MRSLLGFFEEHILNCLHCCAKITQDIILEIQLAKKKEPFKEQDTMLKKVPRYRQKVQIFKSADGTGTKKVPRYNCTRYYPPLRSYHVLFLLRIEPDAGNL